MRRPHPPRTPIERDIVEAEAAVADFAAKQPGRHRDDPALRQRPRPGRRHRLHPDARAAARADGARLRPAAPVRARGRRRPRARARGVQPRPGHLQRRRRRGARALRGGLAGRPAPVAGAAAGRRPAARRAAAPARLPGPRRDRSTSCASGAGSTTATTRRPASVTPTRRARPCSSSASTCASSRSCARAGEEAYHYEREVEEFLRWSPHVRRERATDGVAADNEPLGI